MNPALRILRRGKLLPIMVLAAMGLVAGVVLIFNRRSRPTIPPTPTGEVRVRSLPDPTTPQVWVISIGIDMYKDEAIPSCHGAARDARDVGMWFARTAGWGACNVLMMDERGRPSPDAAGGLPDDLLPTRANLDWAFQRWLAPSLRPDDIVVVFFAGQAVATPPQADAPPGSPARSYLLPIDAQVRRLEKTGWLLDEAIDPVAATGRNPIVCWLDTSLMGRGRRVDRAADFRPSATTMLQKLARWPGVTAWLAADGGPAVEASAVGELSPFVGALLEALGTPERPRNLLACLDLLNRNRALAEQGFRMLGGIDPTLNLWSSPVRRMSQSKRELLLQRGHAGAVTTVAFTADGSRMITGAQDSTIKVWRTSDRTVLRALSYHMVGVTGLALSPDGRRLASGDGAGWLRVWDLAGSFPVPAGPPHERGVDRVAFLPDGTHLAMLDMDGRCWLLELGKSEVETRSLSKIGNGLACASQPGGFALALSEKDGMIRLHDTAGSVLAVLDGPGGVVTSRRLATDGRIMAAGDDVGRFAVWDGRAARALFARTFDAAVDTLGLSPSGRVAVAVGRQVHLFDPTDPAWRDTPQRLDVPGQVNQVAFSDDDRWLAACTATGDLRLWRMDGRPAEPVRLEGDAESPGQTTTVAFSPGGRRIVSGDRDGGIRTWDLPDGNRRPRVPPRRGQIAGLSVSEDARYLLQVTQDRQAQVWDLQHGRALTTLDGRWTSGALAPDGASVYLTSEDEGDVVAVERSTGLRRATVFRRPEESPQRFGRLAISPDGRRVAAGSIEGPLACVWDARTGAIDRVIRGHLDPHPITAIGFSSDSKLLLTASEDGTAKLWDLAGDVDRPLAEYAVIDSKTGDPIPVTAAQVGSLNPRRVVTGAIDGRILLWEDGKGRPIELGSLDGAVLTAAFTPDRRWLAAAGADKSVWISGMDNPRRRLRLEPFPQHAEQVNALVAWPVGTIFASGSDDTTIRLWSLDQEALRGHAEKSLLGTLSAEQGTTDWVAFTPDGLFDSSINGEKQVTWLEGLEVVTLEQVYDTSHVFKLTDRLRRGERPRPPEPPRRPPPRLSIDPPAQPILDRPEIELTIWLSEPKLANLRLYQNGVPVRSGPDLSADRPRVTTKVRLRHGLNRFHVMAGRPGSHEVEGRSETVEVRYDGPDSPGQLHFLALGVSNYERPGHALQFADRDARELADFLHRSRAQVAGSLGLRIVLTNREVTEAQVDEAFLRIRDRVKGRPEDTVVVFLAGHADALRGRFYLLLPNFPFPDLDPRTGRPVRALAPTEIARESVLPYATIYRNLSRINALQRLVVVDACQAEAILDDPGVRALQQLVDHGAQRAKTAYLMAARRGEPAGEVGALSHGLMTYALLKGMGKRDLEAVPGFKIFEDPPNADKDRDGVVTTTELTWYTDLIVPQLARNFPVLVQRAGVDGALKDVRPAANLGQRPRLQASDASFPLIELPRNLARRPSPRRRMAWIALHSEK